MDNKPKLVIACIILGLSLIISAILISNTFYNVKALENSLSVTGSAKKQVVSDMVKWRASFTRVIQESQLKEGYRLMEKDMIVVKKFLTDNKIDESKINFPPMDVTQNYKYNDNSGIREYTLRQSLEIQSNDIPGITNIAKNTKQIAEGGVIFTSDALEYYYSKLSNLRVELLGDAVKDAMSRASTIAQSSGKKVGNIKSASMGVVQVLPVNSIEVSDYGTYDTSSINKEVMVTVRATFSIK